MTMANLFYVIGASGAGKDSLIDYLRHHLAADAPIMIAHRYITRPADAGGENHLALSKAEFQRREQMGCFAMHWFSHDTHYGIGKEIDEWLAMDHHVVVNGSREYLPEASERYPSLVPVLISVDPEILGKRLFDRGRESLDQIQKRLTQAIKLEKQVQHPRLLKISNNERLEDAGKQLLNSILNWNEEKCA
jgi:ribose 1,5-bisphosphokinase